jgi:hypothetical protein
LGCGLLRFCFDCFGLCSLSWVVAYVDVTVGFSFWGGCPVLRLIWGFYCCLFLCFCNVSFGWPICLVYYLLVVLFLVFWACMVVSDVLPRLSVGL